MQRLKFWTMALSMMALAAMLALSLLPGAAQALPAGPLAPLAKSGTPLLTEIHGYHCRKVRGWYRGHKYRHRHAGACHRQYRRSYYPAYRYYYYGPTIYFGTRLYRRQYGQRRWGRSHNRGRIYRRNLRRHYVR